MTVPIFSRIDLVYDRCIIEIIVRHLAHHTIAPMSSSGSTYIPWSKCKATVPKGINVPMCFCGSLCKFMQSEVLGDDYGMICVRTTNMIHLSDMAKTGPR